MEGPIGWIFHRSSGKLVHSRGGSSQPSNDTELVLHSAKDSPSRLQVRFVLVEGFGHFGYIKHATSGKIVHPQGGFLTPGNSMELVYHSDTHADALFTFDEEHERIVHRDGKIWHLEGVHLIQEMVQHAFFTLTSTMQKSSTLAICLALKFPHSLQNTKLERRKRSP